MAGGASAAARARRVNEAAEIVLVERDDHVSFANCGLPYYIGGEIEDRERLLVTTPERLRRRFRIDVRVRHEATAVDRARKVVRVHDRDGDREVELPYDKLILAPGAEPIVPPIENASAHGVFTLRNLEDTDAIHAWIERERPEHAVVVGAGFIGLEMVEQLHHRGVAASLVELAPQVLPLLDPEMARPLEEELAAHGIALHLGDGIAGIEATAGRVTGVALDSGARVPGALVVLGIGVRPSTALARDAGLELGEGGGIRVDAHLRTSDPDVYAVGDAVEYVFGPTGRPLRVALAGPANRAGRIAGEHAATGRAAEMAPVFGTSIVRVFGWSAGLTGLSARLAGRLGMEAASVCVVSNHHAGYYPGAKPLTLKLVYAPDGRVLGLQAVGEAGVDKRLDVAATAMAFGADVRQLAGVDLAYAPPFGSAKDPIHMAAFAACNDLDGWVGFLAPDADLSPYQVVDVRSKAEVEASPLPGAGHVAHVPLDELRERLGELDPARPTVTSCTTGQRAYVAARILLQHGFREVYDLSGSLVLRSRALRHGS